MGDASITLLLALFHDGDRSALDQLVPIVYKEVHKIATGYLRRDGAGQTLQPTALVHEAYLRLLGQEHVAFQSRAHFFGIAAHLMRQILVDHARSRGAAKRGGFAVTLSLNDALDFSAERASSVLALDDALDALATSDKDKALFIELRFFGGMTAEEISESCAVPVHRVRREMRIALAWLHREVRLPGSPT